MNLMNQEKKSNRIILSFSLMALILLLGLFVIFLYLKGFAIPCVFYELTSLKCPGCGNTRALFSLLSLNFEKMFFYNPLFPIELSYMIYVCLNTLVNYINHNRFAYKTFSKYFDISLLVIIILWGILRNIFNI